MSEGAGSRLAQAIQRKLRGNQARADARALRFARYQRAALTIQYSYRAYRVLQISRRKMVASDGNENFNTNTHMIAGIRPIAEENKERWKRLLSGDATFQEKTDMWRSIVELRRAYGYSTDLCVKALLHANGDLTRALSIIGNQEFNFRYGSDKLPTEIYTMFLPTIAKTVTTQKNHNISSSSSKFRLTVSMNKKSRRNEIKAHKKLHEHLYAASHQISAQDQNIEEEDDNNMIDLTDIMWKSYLVLDKRTQYGAI